MSATLEKALCILELLFEHPNGVSVTTIARLTNQPASSVHRTLRQFSQLGYVQQTQTQGEYVLTVRLPSKAIAFLHSTGIEDVAQPILDRLASETGELVRLSVVSNNALMWVAVAQGATKGLRYDAEKDHGTVAHLASSATGQAWLSTLTDEDAVTLVTSQGLRQQDEALNAPQTLGELLDRLKHARDRGYGAVTESHVSGMSAIAVPIWKADRNTAIGCVSIAGPTVRLSPRQMADFAEKLKMAAEELSVLSLASGFLRPNHQSSR